MLAPSFLGTFLVAASLLLNTCVYGSPTTLVKRISFSPHITYPTGKTVWHAGGKGACKWETSGIPEEARRHTCTVLLGYLTGGSDSYHLDTRHPLAKGVPIGAGKADFKLPKNLPTRSSYIIVLMGNSGNMSQKFRVISRGDFTIVGQNGCRGKREDGEVKAAKESVQLSPDADTTQTDKKGQIEEMSKVDEDMKERKESTGKKYYGNQHKCSGDLCE